MATREMRLQRAVVIGNQIWRMDQMRCSALEQEIESMRAREAASLQAVADIEPQLFLPRVNDLATTRVNLEIALLDARARARDSGRRFKLTKKAYDRVRETSDREESVALSRNLAMRTSVSAG